MICISSPQQAYDYFRSKLPNDVEEFWIAALNPGKKVIASRCLFRGSADQCLFHPRDVFRFAIQNNATGFLVAHNHPSGEPEPSIEDLHATERLLRVAAVVQIEMIDHIVVAGDRYYSFRENGRMRIKDPAWLDDP